MDYKDLRLLTPDDIEVRVGQAYENKCTLLLYKNARVDMNILDEWVGPMNWTRTHDVINDNLFCTVSIYDDDRKVWIGKQDVGTESNVDKQKGEASDSFKRACVNWGIGRELYTSPNIWVDLAPSETGRGKTGNITVKTQFHVKEIEYEDRKITRLVIVDRKGIVRFHTGQRVSAPVEDTPAPAPRQAPPPQQKQKPAPAPKQKPAPAPAPSPDGYPDMVLTFGKHKDRMLSDVWKTDRQYCEWMLGSDRINNSVKQMVLRYIDLEEEGIEPPAEPEQADLFNPIDPEDLGDIPF